jgi:hypothetical protein
LIDSKDKLENLVKLTQEDKIERKKIDITYPLLSLSNDKKANEAKFEVAFKKLIGKRIQAWAKSESDLI